MMTFPWRTFLVAVCLAVGTRGDDGAVADRYASHLAELKGKLPEGGFAVLVQPPFVVVSDAGPVQLKRFSEGTIAWSVKHLKRLYFEQDPADIIDIWLFKDKTSYEKYSKQLFNHPPDTPFGYYSETYKALVMNIGTGGGTLVHEIVHPFMAVNFPACPSWFNEGLASLYEQSSERDGAIVGLTNWRLAGLQRAIQAGGLPTFQQLTATTSDQFYNGDKGGNYAQARYLCYYLQEHGLLTKFYHAFVKDCKTDPTGYATLQATLGETDMAAFQKRWETWVMKLTFP